jgi:hypothetical protein
VESPESSPDFDAPDRLSGAVKPRATPPVAVKTSGASRSTSGLRVASYVALGAGAAALGGAGVVRLMAQSDLNDLEARLNDKGRIDPTDTQALALRNSLASKGNTLTGLLVGSGAALFTGTVLFLLSPSQSTPPPVAVGVSVERGGTTATLSGSF